MLFSGNKKILHLYLKTAHTLYTETSEMIRESASERAGKSSKAEKDLELMSTLVEKRE